MHRNRYSVVVQFCSYNHYSILPRYKKCIKVQPKSIQGSCNLQSVTQTELSTKNTAGVDTSMTFPVTQMQCQVSNQMRITNSWQFADKNMLQHKTNQKLQM